MLCMQQGEMQKVVQKFFSESATASLHGKNNPCQVALYHLLCIILYMNLGHTDVIS